MVGMKNCVKFAQKRCKLVDTETFQSRGLGGWPLREQR